MPQHKTQQLHSHQHWSNGELRHWPRSGCSENPQSPHRGGVRRGEVDNRVERVDGWSFQLLESLGACILLELGNFQLCLPAHLLVELQCHEYLICYYSPTSASWFSIFFRSIFSLLFRLGNFYSFFKFTDFFSIIFILLLSPLIEF